MEHTKEEIIQALELIKDICENPPDNSCCSCPFEKDGGCSIKDFYPSDWHINKPDNQWRALI